MLFSFGRLSEVSLYFNSFISVITLKQKINYSKPLKFYIWDLLSILILDKKKIKTSKFVAGKLIQGVKWQLYHF